MNVHRIFKALDGAHLDEALFGGHLNRKQSRGNANARDEQTSVSGGDRLRRGRSRFAAFGRETSGKAHSDTGL